MTSSFRFAGLALGLIFGAGRAGAAVNTAPAVARGSGGQAALALGFDEQGQLRARVCPAEPCTLDGATAIAVPPDAASAASSAKLRVARIGLERKAIVVEIPLPAAGRAWVAVVAAPLKGTAPVTPFAGYTGLVEGTEGERSGPAVAVREEGIYIGVQREGQDLCGRPALLAPEALDPATLTLKPAKLQRLTTAEQEAATPLAATFSEPSALPALLTAQWATSAAPGRPASALTDGKLETSWAENRGGAGRGEFAVMRAPREVPLAGFDLVLPLRDREVLHATVPRELFLLTDAQSYKVTLPPDATTKFVESGSPPKPSAATLSRATGAPKPEPRPELRYTVTLPAPVKTACVALIVESAADTHKDAVVGIAEVAARPATAGDVETLVRSLAGGGPDAEAAASVLRATGPAAFSAVVAAFSGLDEGGRRVALDVLDEAPCDVALPAYIEARLGPSEGNARHASGAFPRCPESAAVIAAALPPLPPEKRVVLADELSSLSPEAMVNAVVPLLDAAKTKERRAYRALIGGAVQSDRARAALGAHLDAASTTPRTVIEILRAAGPGLPQLGPAGSRAFARVATPKASFRSRYLLLGPAVELAPSDAGALAFLRQSLTADSRAEIRAEAARTVRDGKALYAELVRGADDSRVRVREASIAALGKSRLESAAPYLVRRLRADGWPLVRTAAAVALTDLAPSPALDAELADSVEEDESLLVRRASIRGLGVHRAASHAEIVREKLADEDEDPTVRAEAALALGGLCDAESVKTLTEHALRLADPQATEDQRSIGRNALASLSALRPADLQQRIAKLQDKKAPPVVRSLAHAALSSPARCAPPASPKKK
jgi:HEAT repeat protein